MARTWPRILVTPALVMFAAGGCWAESLKPGGAAPSFQGLKGTDDKTHSLDDFKKAKAVVVVFTCNHCPVAMAYETRLVEIQKDYKDKGVQIVAICVNDVDGDRLEAMKQRANEKKFNFPYLRDDSQKTARDYAAIVTPHVFVLDKNRKIAYIGAVDDNNEPKSVKEHYLRDALDSVLAEKKPPKEVTQQRGCSIKWTAKE